MLEKIAKILSNLEIEIKINQLSSTSFKLETNYIYAANLIADSLELELVLPFVFDQITNFKQQLASILSSRLQAEFNFKELKLIVKSKISSYQTQKGSNNIGKIKNIIAVASGKGGVGKSTLAASLALHLQAQGAKVGVLDADIYGPSQATIFGLTEKPKIVENKIIPLEYSGIKIISIASLVNNDDAMIWRGPMVSGALSQLMFQTNWEELDYLILDLPPGTGDIQLTMVQKIPVTTAVLVTTKHPLAKIDVIRAAAMFKKVNINISGLIENMTYTTCQKCGHQQASFEDKDFEDSNLSSIKKLANLAVLPVNHLKVNNIIDNQELASLAFKLQLEIIKLKKNLSFGLQNIEME